MKPLHTSDISQTDGPRLRIGLSDLNQPENVLSFAVSDDALEISAGSSVEGAPTLAAGSYCFTCPTTFE